jgi:hypothetical protein
MLKGQGLLYEAWRAAATAKYFRIEVGQYKHGLHCVFTFEGPQV